VTSIVKVREPDHSKAKKVYVALDLLMEQVYRGVKATPDSDFAGYEVTLQDAVNNAGAVYVSTRFRLPLIVVFETEQAQYRLVRTRKDYRCEVCGLSHIRKEKRA
jgi:hypothetical protein